VAPTTVTRRRNTLYFGTGFRDATIIPVDSPGLESARRLADRQPSPRRADEVVADSRWRTNAWRRHRTGPAVYTQRVGGSKPRNRLGRDDRRVSGSPTPRRTAIRIYQRDKGHRPNRAPGPSRRASRLPCSLFDWRSEIFKLAGVVRSEDQTSSTARRARLDYETPGTADADAEKTRKFTLGGRLPWDRERQPRSILPGWHDTGRQLRSKSTSGKSVWKFHDSRPERGGVTTTDSGPGFAAVARGLARLRSADGAKCSGVPGRRAPD